MSDGLLAIVLVVSVIGAIALPFVIFACFWPVLRKTHIVKTIVGRKRRPSRWRTRKMLFLALKNTLLICASPFMAFWQGAEIFGKRLWGGLNWLTKQKPGDLASVAVWFVIAALLFKPLFGNPFSQAGWSNAFSEPAGFLIFVTIALVALLLIISANRSGTFILSEEWKRVALRSTIALLVFGGIAYFLFFAVQAHNSDKENENGATNQAMTKTPNTAPPSVAQYGIAIGPSASTPAPAPSAPLIVIAELTGTEELGVKLFDLAPGQHFQVTYRTKTGGEVCTWNVRKTNSVCANAAGFLDNDVANYKYRNGDTPLWAPAYRYSHIPGVEAGEALVVIGEVGSGNEEIFQFGVSGDLSNAISVSIGASNTTNERKSVYLYLNVTTGFWEDHLGNVFPSKEIAESLGYHNVRYRKDFNPEYYYGSMSFTAEILD